MAPVLINVFFPDSDALSQLTGSVIAGVVVTLLGIAIIGYAGKLKSDSQPKDVQETAVKEFNFPKVSPSHCLPAS